MQMMTQEIIDMLPKFHATENRDATVIVKFFTPWAGASWYVVEGEKQDDGDWLFFGFVTLGDPEMAELGYFSLSELTEVSGPGGMKVERDLHYSGELLSVVMDREKA